MANKEQDYKPQAKPADEATKPCQEFIRLYPTRFALTDKAFENIKTKGEIPLLMKLKGIDGDPHKRWSMWFNSKQREEPYQVLTSF